LNSEKEKEKVKKAKEKKLFFWNLKNREN